MREERGCSGVPGRTDRAKQVCPVGDGATRTPDASPFAEEATASAPMHRKTDKSERDAYAAIVRKAPPPASFEQRWSVWAAGYGGSQTTGGNPALGSNTATSSVYGTALGADYHFSPFTMTGSRWRAAAPISALPMLWVHRQRRTRGPVARKRAIQTLLPLQRTFAS